MRQSQEGPVRSARARPSRTSTSPLRSQQRPARATGGSRADRYVRQRSFQPVGGSPVPLAHGNDVAPISPTGGVACPKAALITVSSTCPAGPSPQRSAIRPAACQASARIASETPSTCASGSQASQNVSSLNRCPTSGSSRCTSQQCARTCLIVFITSLRALTQNGSQLGWNGFAAAPVRRSAAAHPSPTEKRQGPRSRTGWQTASRSAKRVNASGFGPCRRPPGS